ncbi:hypothetical protein MAPG_04223, partial [Magnaporthiopsis poae ATCC 64411]
LQQQEDQTSLEDPHPEIANEQVGLPAPASLQSLFCPSPLPQNPFLLPLPRSLLLLLPYPSLYQISCQSLPQPSPRCPTRSKSGRQELEDDLRDPTARPIKTAGPQPHPQRLQQHQSPQNKHRHQHQTPRHPHPNKPLCPNPSPLPLPLPLLLLFLFLQSGSSSNHNHNHLLHRNQLRLQNRRLKSQHFPILLLAEPFPSGFLSGWHRKTQPLQKALPKLSAAAEPIPYPTTLSRPPLPPHHTRGASPPAGGTRKTSIVFPFRPSVNSPLRGSRRSHKSILYKESLTPLKATLPPTLPPNSFFSTEACP